MVDLYGANEGRLTMATRSAIPAKDLKKRNLAESKPQAGTIRCLRCGGLMVIDQCFDSTGDAGNLDLLVRRCVQCGEVIDPVILQNRRLRLGKYVARV